MPANDNGHSRDGTPAHKSQVVLTPSSSGSEGAPKLAPRKRLFQDTLEQLHSWNAMIKDHEASTKASSEHRFKAEYKRRSETPNKSENLRCNSVTDADYASPTMSAEAVHTHAEQSSVRHECQTAEPDMQDSAAMGTRAAETSKFEYYGNCWQCGTSQGYCCAHPECVYCRHCSGVQKGHDCVECKDSDWCVCCRMPSEDEPKVSKPSTDGRESMESEDWDTESTEIGPMMTEQEFAERGILRMENSQNARCEWCGFGVKITCGHANCTYCRNCMGVDEGHECEVCEKYKWCYCCLHLDRIPEQRSPSETPVPTVENTVSDTDASNPSSTQSIYGSHDQPSQDGSTIFTSAKRRKVSKSPPSAPATHVPEDYRISYWATVECGSEKINIPIKPEDVNGDEKQILEHKMKKIWKWVQEKVRGGQISLQDAFDLAKSVYDDEKVEKPVKPFKFRSFDGPPVAKPVPDTVFDFRATRPAVAAVNPFAGITVPGTKKVPRREDDTPTPSPIEYSFNKGDNGVDWGDDSPVSRLWGDRDQ